MHSPVDMPDRARIEEIREPYIRATVLAPKEHVGAVMELCQERRGEHVDMSFLSDRRACRSATTCRSPRSCSTSSTS